MACGFLLMMELVPTKNQAAVGAALMVAEGSVQIVWTVYFVFISPNAVPFLWFITLLNVITAIVCLWIVESPRYLYSTQQFERCGEVLEKIASYNGHPEYIAPRFEVEYDVLVEDQTPDTEVRMTGVNDDP